MMRWLNARLSPVFEALVVKKGLKIFFCSERLMLQLLFFIEMACCELLYCQVWMRIFFCALIAWTALIRIFSSTCLSSLRLALIGLNLLFSLLMKLTCACTLAVCTSTRVFLTNALRLTCCYWLWRGRENLSNCWITLLIELIFLSTTDRYFWCIGLLVCWRKICT